MTYKELVELYPCIDLFLELFKGLAPTIVAVLAIIINNLASTRRERKSNEMRKIKEINQAKISVLNEMLGKYIQISQLFWISGTHLILYLSYEEDDKRNKEVGEFEQSIYKFQFKAQEIYDYYSSMMKQYDFKIGCNSSIKDAYEYSDRLLSICEKNSYIYMITDEKEKNLLLDKVRDEIKDATIEAKKWTNVIMVEISKKIKELNEE